MKKSHWIIAEDWYTLYEIPLPPEQRLLQAVLHRAAWDILKKPVNDTEALAQKEAINWIRSKSDDEFSFRQICTLLGRSPKLVRNKILIQQNKCSGHREFCHRFQKYG